jgi:hypothetical protein
MQALAEGEDALLQHELHAGRGVGPALRVLGHRGFVAEAAQRQLGLEAARLAEGVEEALGDGAFVEGREVEVALIDLVGLVVLGGDDLAQLVGVRGLAEGAEGHGAALAVVGREAEIRGERRVDEAEGVGERHLHHALDLGLAVLPLAFVERGAGPVADGVDDQDGGLAEARAHEGLHGVAEVVREVADLVRAYVEARRDGVDRPELAPEPGLEGVDELLARGGEGREGRGDDARELGVRVFVEDDLIEIGWRELGAREDELDGVGREIGVVLLPGEALFGRGGDHLAVDDQAGRRVVVAVRDTEHLHRQSLLIWLLSYSTKRCWSFLRAAMKRKGPIR